MYPGVELRLYRYVAVLAEELEIVHGIPGGGRERGSRRGRAQGWRESERELGRGRKGRRSVPRRASRRRLRD